MKYPERRSVLLTAFFAVILQNILKKHRYFDII